MRLRINLPGILLVLAILLAWQVLAATRQSPSFPTVVAVAEAFRSGWPELLRQLGNTLLRAASGFAISMVVMLPLGVVLGRIRALGDLVEPVVELLRPLPPIAIVPVAMIFLGIGDAAKIAVIVYGASFPILVSTIDAVRSLDPMLSHVARSLRLTRLERMRLVDFPASQPRIVSGIRIAIAQSLLLAVVAEMLISTNGLGAYLMRAQEGFQIARVIASLVLIAGVALLINLATEHIERRILAWHRLRNGLA